MFTKESLTALLQVKMEAAGADHSFPLATATESFLNEIGVEFTTFPVKGLTQN